jgi:Rrf2 family protein
MYLASKYGQGPIPLKTISKDQVISAKYLENLMRMLAAAGIVYSTKGNKGGFVLARDPKSITVHDVLSVAEGSLFPVECIECPAKCSRSANCASRDMWAGLGDVMQKYLKEVTLDSLAGMQRAKTGKKAVN